MVIGTNNGAIYLEVEIIYKLGIGNLKQEPVTKKIELNNQIE